MAVRSFLALPLFVIVLGAHAGQEQDILQKVNSADCASPPKIDASELEALTRFQTEMAKDSLKKTF